LERLLRCSLRCHPVFFAQSSPLTVVPSGNKVGINQPNPQSTLDVGGNVNVSGGRGKGVGNLFRPWMLIDLQNEKEKGQAHF
jgi:hypothetical protein